MKLCAALPITPVVGRPFDSEHIPRCARWIEDAGYTSLWVFDTVGRGYIIPDPITALAACAAVTGGIELGTGVLQLPIRRTRDLAHRLYTLHLLAGDRLLLGVGPGSTADDFRAFEGDYEERFARFRDQVPRLRALLETGAEGDVDFKPWAAVRGGPKVLYGAWRGPWVERAAKEADGWVASAAHNDDATLADAIARYRDAGGARAVVTNVQAHDELEPALERLAHLEELGFDDGVLFDLQPTEDRLRSAVKTWQGR